MKTDSHCLVIREAIEIDRYLSWAMMGLADAPKTSFVVSK